MTKLSSNTRIFSLSADALKERGLTTETIGDLMLPDGRVVAMDPLVQPDALPQSRRVKPGSYPVSIVVGTPKYSSAALLVIRFAEGVPDRFAMGVPEGRSAEGLKDDEYYGVPVDAGLAAFANTAFAADIEKREAEEIARIGDDYSNYYDDVLAAQFPGTTSSEFGLHKPLPEGTGAAAISQSGWGDGFYPVIWGLDANGTPMLAYIDFQVIENADNSSDPEVAKEKRLASMGEAEKDANRAAYAALKADDGKAFADILEQGLVGPKSEVIESGGSFVFEAIRLDKPEILSVMLAGGLTDELSPFDNVLGEEGGYAAYAKRLQSNTDARATPDSKPLPARSPELMRLVEELAKRGVGDTQTPVSDNAKDEE
ncbi:DUF4241 domain-containing protein [Fulvimarina sp. MAC3]|uniref:DUF4241 domain-containing protein n=1 Tax=Fulvimarina sp. MAC3 TaxID=3148887 RepID=UPI0031FDD889